MDIWVTDSLEKFREIYLQYDEGERALRSCAMAMMKLLNGFSEMSYTKFYRYEKKILGNAMKLFAQQCIEQMNLAHECREVEEKKEYIDDLEYSISAMIEAYKNTMGGVSNAERKIFQSLPVDVKVHDLSPKLCAFYSSILEKVVSMFGEDNIEYAFVLHPTLYSTIEAEVLLKTRKESGKVVIIHISESMIEEFDVVSICLLHEAFHILSKERLRAARANSFMVQMLEQVQHQIFRGISFGINENEMNEIDIKEKLISKWFGDVKNQMNEFAQRDKEDKCFYSEKIKTEVVNRFKECLGKIDMDLNHAVMNVLCKGRKYENYPEYQEEARNIEKNVAMIKRNIYYIVSENLLAGLADQLMFIYRETYADIACILLLEMESDLYEKAFARSIPFRFDQPYMDEARMLRQSAVAEVLASVSTASPKFCRSWAAAVNKDYTKYTKTGLQTGGFCGKIILDTEIRQNYEEYLKKCITAFSARLQNLEGLEEFRIFMGNVTGSLQHQTLQKILKGEVL